MADKDDFLSDKMLDIVDKGTVEQLRRALPPEGAQRRAARAFAAAPAQTVRRCAGGPDRVRTGQWRRPVCAQRRGQARSTRIGYHSISPPGSCVSTLPEYPGRWVSRLTGLPS